MGLIMSRNFRFGGGSRNPGVFGQYTKPKEPKESSNHDCNYDDTTHYSHLFLAVHNGQLKVARSLLKEDSLEGEVSGKKLIHIAAARGHKQIICLLRKRNAAIDKGDKDGNTPLHLAIKGNHTGVVHLLLHEATANVKNIRKATPLHVATEMGNSLVVGLLLKGGAKVDEKDEDGKTPLHIAAGNPSPNIRIIMNLLTHGASVHASCKNGCTPLHYVTTSGSVDITNVLIDRGASISIKDITGMSPLCLAMQKNKTEMIKYILKKRTDVESTIPGQMTPLHFAAETGNEEVVKLLLTEGDAVKINAKDKGLKTPLHFSAANGHVKVLKYLIQCGAEIDPETAERDTPLHLSAAAGSLEIVSELLDRGAKIDLFNITGFTPLALATKGRKKEVVMLLLKKGASATHFWKPHEYLHGLVHGQHKMNIIPAFHIAAKTGDEEIVKIFLESGVEVDFKSENDKTALHFAATYGHRISVEELIKAGADINSRTRFLETPLHLAAASGRVSTVKYLLNSGAKILTTKRGYTPLHYALDRERYDVVINPNKSPILTKMNRLLFTDDYFLKDVLVTPSSFENYLQITQMLLMKGALSWALTSEGRSALDYAFKIKVSKKEQSKSSSSFLGEVSRPYRITESVEFRPEIVGCLLSYTAELSFFEKSLDPLSMAIMLKCLPLVDVILEYDSHNFTQYLMEAVIEGDLNITLAIIEKISDIQTILNLLCDVAYLRTLVLNPKTDISKLFIAILVKLKFTSKMANIAQSRELEFREVGKSLEWYTQCKIEVMNMRGRKIHPQFDITFYDILTKPVSKLASFAKNENLMQILDSGCFEEFPAYSLCLERSIKKGKARKELLELSSECFLHLIREYCEMQLSSLIIDKIFEYLSVTDLRKLSATIHRTLS